MFIHKKATRALADNRELSKLTPAKMFDAINKGEGYNETEKPEKYAKFHYI